MRTIDTAPPPAAGGSGTIRALLLAGLAGQPMFEVVPLALMPVLLGMPLMPAALIVTLGQAVFGLQLPMLAGWTGHLAAGIVLFLSAISPSAARRAGHRRLAAPPSASRFGSSRRACSPRSPGGPSCSASFPTPGPRSARTSPMR